LKISISNRILLFSTALLASYQVAVGVEGLELIPIIIYSIGFGTLLVASLLLVILGYDALLNSSVAIISTLIPLSLSCGLIWDYAAHIRVAYFVFAILGLLAISISRLLFSGKSPNIVLALVHGVAGFIIFTVPIYAYLQSLVPLIFLWVSIGGGFVGIGGSMLYLLKSGNSKVPHSRILKLFPVLLFLATISFVIGFMAYR